MRPITARRAVPALIVTAAITAASLSAVAVAATTRSVTNGASELSYSKKTLAAKPGKLTLAYRNTGAAQHNIALRGNGLRAKLGPVVGPGRTSRVSATVRKGRYTFYCSVPGHEAAGMKGTLVVR